MFLPPPACHLSLLSPRSLSLSSFPPIPCPILSTAPHHSQIRRGGRGRGNRRGRRRTNRRRRQTPTTRRTSQPGTRGSQDRPRCELCKEGTQLQSKLQRPCRCLCHVPAAAATACTRHRKISSAPSSKQTSKGVWSRDKWHLGAETWKSMYAPTLC